MSNEIIILFNGYSNLDPLNSSILLANCSCVLIKTAAHKIIVDTMTPWDGDAIVTELLKHGVTANEIDYVVSTHGHSDHTGNNNLFLNAKHIVGTNVSHKTYYFIHDFETEPYKISDDIIVMATPGHTLACVSVIVSGATINGLDHTSPKVVAIAGDLFENADDPFDEYIWLGAVSENPTLQRRNRSKIANIADYIIPGHGKIFMVTDAIRKVLKDAATANGQNCVFGVE